MATHCVSNEGTDISEKLCQEERNWIAVASGQSWGFQGILVMHCFTFRNTHILDFKKEAEFISCHRFSCNLNILVLFRLLPAMTNLNHVQYNPKNTVYCQHQSRLELQYYSRL